MSVFVVEGGHQLKGTLTPKGAKNEALEVICATLLTADPVEISNIPNISDVRNLIQLLADMGVKVLWTKPDTCRFQADDINLDYLQTAEFQKKAQSLRGSVMIMGPLTARFGISVIPKPGGDKIGRRRLDTHFMGLTMMGAEFHYNKEERIYSLKAPRGLKGTYMLLDEASVTGTANIVMAASMAMGETTVYNAACEPYIQQLCKMLVSMGAEIEGIGSNLLTIRGKKELHGCSHRLLPDMIEVGSFIGMAAMTGSDLTLNGCGVKDLGLMPMAFSRMGINIEISGDDIRIHQQDIYEVENFIDGGTMSFSDAPWPGLSPDLLSIFLVVATQAVGSVLIHQKMFESRLFFVDKLIDMGARIILCDPHRAVVIGSGKFNSLRSTRMISPDIRAGVAMLIAAMGAKGTSIIQNIDQIDRGYENIDDRLNKLGAHIERFNEDRI